MSLEEFEVKALNYGSKSKPRFTTEVRLGLTLEASPDEVHSTMVDEGLISVSTVPCTTVFNFRGSSLGKSPYYVALVEYMGSVLEYQVAPAYIGGTVDAPIYRPVVSPRQLETVHPVKFKSIGVRVLKFVLSNYTFAPGLQHYRELYVDVRGEDELSIVKALFREFGLGVKSIPHGQALASFGRSVVRLKGPELMQRILRELVKGDL